MGVFRFHEQIDKTETGSLKGEMTPDALRAADMPYYWGAEFDFPTCPAFSEGVKRCAERGYYPFTLQTEAYNTRVSWWMEHLRNWQIQPEWIVPTHGTIFSLATTIRLLVPEGKKVLIIQPGYSRYEQAAVRLGRSCTHVHMACDRETARYQLDLNALEQAMADPNNRLLVFSNPNNPTGMIMDENDLRAIDALSRKYGIAVFSDEIFAETARNGATVIPYGKVAQEDSLAITCTSLGKCMSLTGVNHANVLITNPVLREQFITQKYADHYGSIDPMLYAGLLSAYTQDGKDFVDALNCVTEENYRYFKQSLERILPGCRVTPNTATYLAWVNYSGTGMTSEELSDLFEKAMFIGDSGTEYCADSYCYRYSIAVPHDALKKSMAYLEKIVGQERSRRCR